MTDNNRKDAWRSSRPRMNDKVVEPYAEALFQMAVSIYVYNEDYDSMIYYGFLNDFQEVLALLVQVPELITYLNDPSFTVADKKDMFMTLLGPKRRPKVLKFLFLLLDNNRIDQLEYIIKSFLDRAYYFAGVRYVQVCSPNEFTLTQQKALSSKLHTMLDHTFVKERGPGIVKLVLRNDEKLLAGFVIMFGSKLIDLSLRGELRRLGKALGLNYFDLEELKLGAFRMESFSLK